MTNQHAAAGLYVMFLLPQKVDILTRNYVMSELITFQLQVGNKSNKAATVFVNDTSEYEKVTTFMGSLRKFRVRDLISGGVLEDVSN